MIVWFIQNRKNHIRHSGESRKPVFLIGSGYRIKSGMTVYDVCTKPLFLNAVTLSWTGADKLTFERMFIS